MRMSASPGLLPLGLLVAPAAAQIHSVSGDLRMDLFGESVDGAGDVDGDGFADYGDANAPDFCCAFTSPQLRVYSGLTGASLSSSYAEWWDIFGRSLEAAGDPNNDSFDDVLVGEPDNRGGVVSLRTGPSGALALQIVGTGNEGIGYFVAGVGDWDGDLRNDFAYSNRPGSATPTTTAAVSTGSAGVGEVEVDLTAPTADSGPGQITSGATMHFQFWYRDPMGGSVGYNFSEGLSVTFSD